MIGEETAIFRREGEYWTIVYRGEVLRLRHTSGVGLLARLLGRAGEAVPIEELQSEIGAASRRSDAREPALRSRNGPAADRERLKVSRAIRSALRRIRESHTGLAEHLQGTIRTGKTCAYRPDPLCPIRWRT